jgi:uncharacterized protein with HEPN domain
VKPTLSDRLEHIEVAIDRIRKALAEHTQESFANDVIVRLAVERLLEIISEASRFIPLELKSREPAVNWRALADLGNWLRHAYHRTDAELMWSMVEDDLEPLKKFVEVIAKESGK